MYYLWNSVNQRVVPRKSSTRVRLLLRLFVLNYLEELSMIIIGRMPNKVDLAGTLAYYSKAKGVGIDMSSTLAAE